MMPLKRMQHVDKKRLIEELPKMEHKAPFNPIDSANCIIDYQTTKIRHKFHRPFQYAWNK
jgi:hypothetical protein